MMITDEGIDLLRCAIVKQAAEDYKKVINGKKHHPKYGKYNRNELEIFFHSSWFEMLVDIDGDNIIKEIKKASNRKDGE